jgi:cob(I)alamin adenosyltransferase
MASITRDNLGLVQVYTGKGKGKTTFSLGIALRALGSGMKVAVVQFMKGGGYTGEFVAANNFFPDYQFSFSQFGKGCVNEDLQLKLGEATVAGKCKKGDFIRESKDCGDCRWCFTYEKEIERENVRAGLGHAKKLLESGNWDIVVLDEINCAVAEGIVEASEVLELAKIVKKSKKVELILTGRNAPQEFIDFADLVTDMNEVKHPWQKGIAARKGIEY